MQSPCSPTPHAVWQRAHRVLLFIWRYLPLPARRLAILALYPRVPIGAVAVIRDGEGRLLLVRQTYHRVGVRWAAPGGWLGRRETPQQAAERETWEETGLRVKAGRVLATGGGPYGEISIAYECEVVGDAGFTPSEETDQIGYFAVDALPEMTVDTRRLMDRALAAQERWRDVQPPLGTTAASPPSTVVGPPTGGDPS
ncbi:MAG: NUDIX domain-containing protein [Chloroflexi bacterium]|nr:NUDIX domain-containing protein [Chloroflexota bacterium]